MHFSRFDLLVRQLLNDLGEKYRQIRDRITVTRIFPFNSRKKKMSVITDQNQLGYRYFVKGASEIVLQQCTSFLNADGTVAKLSDDLRAALGVTTKYSRSVSMLTLFNINN